MTAETHTIPTIPERMRSEVLRCTRSEYLDGRIDEDEFESRIEDALAGRLRFEDVLKQEDALRTGNSVMFFGVELEPGDIVEADETPNPFDI